MIGLDDAELLELTGYRHRGKQYAWLRANSIPYFVAASGRPVVNRQDLSPNVPRTTREVSLDYSSGPWYAEKVTPHVWMERNRAALFLPLAELATRRVVYEQIAPGEPGIYFLFDDAELLYVGKSVSVENRLFSHRRERRIPFTHVAWVIVPELLLGTIEGEYIATLCPPWNVRGVPEAGHLE